MLSCADVERLYRARASYLQRLVALDTCAGDEVIEEACQHAWTSVIAHRERVDGGGAFAWLARTATREAWRLSVRRDDAPATSGGNEPRADGPARIVELRDRLGQIRRLPTRQQRLLWLSAAGLSYAEMARQEQLTMRTVERQLLRGRRTVRALDCGENVG
jgi:RNA polymerase sigma factor (sigma-70 family)